MHFYFIQLPTKNWLIFMQMNGQNNVMIIFLGHYSPDIKYQGTILDIKMSLKSMYFNRATYDKVIYSVSVDN